VSLVSFLWSKWAVVPPVALVGGVLGGLFSRAVFAGSRAVRRALPRRRHALPLALGTGMALLGLATGGAHHPVIRTPILTLSRACDRGESGGN